VIIGDTVHDVACAKGAGAVSVAVGSGWTPRDSLLALEPDHYYDDLADAARFLREVVGE